MNLSVKRPLLIVNKDQEWDAGAQRASRGSEDDQRRRKDGHKKVSRQKQEPQQVTVEIQKETTD